MATTTRTTLALSAATSRHCFICLQRQSSIQVRHYAVSKGPRRDEAIASVKVVVIDQEGKHHGEMSLRRALANMDRDKYWLQAVDTKSSPPICRIFEKAELIEKEKRQKEAQKAAENRNVEREVQISWTIAKLDMSRKIAEMRKFAETGQRLRITIQNSKQKRYEKVDEATRSQVLDAVRSALADVATETRTEPGNAKRHILYYQGRRP